MHKVFSYNIAFLHSADVHVCMYNYTFPALSLPSWLCFRSLSQEVACCFETMGCMIMRC